MKKILLSFLSTSLIASTTSSAIACSTKNVVFIDSSFYVLSVGNGLFTFLKYDTDKAIVFDTGVGGNPTQWIQDDFRKNPFPSDFMKSQGVKEIEAIFLTHYHTDHYANLYKVDEEFKINNLVLPYDHSGFLEKINKGQILVDKDEINIITDFKEEYNFGGITFNNWTYYIQDYLKKTTNQNNKSTFLQFTINDISFLITGDSEAAEATQIVNNDNINLIPIDVYQVPHHGSANSAGPNFLKKIEPKYCYISGTSSESEEPNWSKFDGGHPFPTASALNNLSNYCDKELSLTGTPYNDNTRDLDNYNYSYEFKVKADKTFETITHKETILVSLN